MRALGALVSGLLLAALLGPLGACATLCHTSSHLEIGRYGLDPGDYSEYWRSTEPDPRTGGSDTYRTRFTPSDYTLTIADDFSTVEESYVEEGRQYHIVYRVTEKRRVSSN